MIAAQTKSELPALELVRAARLGVILDVDGTLIPHALTPVHAWIDDPVRSLLGELASAPGTEVAIVSGRRRVELDAMVGRVPGLVLVAEHGAWHRPIGGEWDAAAMEGTRPNEIESRLRAIADLHVGALVEHKRWSATLHYLRVAPERLDEMLVEAMAAIEEWLAAHPEYELLEGSSVLEVRHRGANKGAAVDWVRGRFATGARLLAIGDDVTDEDAFARLGPHDLPIRVGRPDRPTRARTFLPDVSAVHAFIRELIATRRSGTDAIQVSTETAETPERTGLLIVSNRLPDLGSARGAGQGRHANVGGLVSGLVPALMEHGGTWLGWSGRHAADPATLVVRDELGLRLAAFDLDPELHDRFYNGFANRALWPILHCLPGRARCEDDDWRAYVRANDRFAEHALRLVTPDGQIWAHDYHLLLLAEALRRRGHAGPLGHFLHVPFPPLDLFETLPWAAEIVRAMLAFDLLGFHTRRYVENFVRCAIHFADAVATENGVRVGGRTVELGVFPLGIDASGFQPDPDQVEDARIEALTTALAGRKLVLGVDRLDYSKGIVERLDAFDRFLAEHPDWRGRVSMVQVAVPSRADVPEYAAQRTAIESRVGAINGRWGEAHWVPVRYVYRSYPRDELARLYRAADVGLVTPLRDGMNLVAKEYVAAQDPEQPGVLVLSRFAGAADELEDALLTNPYDRTGVAREIARALEMPLAERRARHARLSERVALHAPPVWASDFLRTLESVAERLVVAELA